MSVKSRVDKLERAAGLVGGETCICPINFEVRYYDDAADRSADERPPEVCGACGREKNLLCVVYVESRRAA